MAVSVDSLKTALRVLLDGLIHWHSNQLYKLLDIHVIYTSLKATTDTNNKSVQLKNITFINLIIISDK